MSKEFEEIVLKKLNMLDEKTSNTDKIIKNIILKKLDNIETEVKDNTKRLENLETEVKDNTKRLENLETEVKDNTKRLENLETEVKDNTKRLENLETEVKDNTKRLGILEIEVKDTGESLLELRQRFAIFDFEINRKIDTLFDSDTVNKENIVSLNVKNYNHNTRISNLENKDLHLVKL